MPQASIILTGITITGTSIITGLIVKPIIINMTYVVEIATNMTGYIRYIISFLKGIRLRGLSVRLWVCSKSHDFGDIFCANGLLDIEKLIKSWE